MGNWYRVTKKIHGRFYDYWQRTERQGKKVKTFNVYIGPTATLKAPIAGWRHMTQSSRYNARKDRIFYDAMYWRDAYDKLRAKTHPKEAPPGCECTNCLAARASSPPLAARSPSARALMAFENDIWDRLGITSGSHLADDPALRAKYDAAVAAAFAPGGRFANRKISSAVIDKLTDENYHTLNQYLETHDHVASSETKSSSSYFHDPVWHEEHGIANSPTATPDIPNLAKAEKLIAKGGGYAHVSSLAGENEYAASQMARSAALNKDYVYQQATKHGVRINNFLMRFDAETDSLKRFRIVNELMAAISDDPRPTAQERREDERIRYGNRAARLRKVQAAIRKAKRETRGFKKLNPFIAKGIKKKPDGPAH